METIKKHKTLQILWLLVFGVPDVSKGWGADFKYIIAFCSAVILGPALGYTYGVFYQKDHKLLAAGKGLAAAYLLYRLWVEFENPETFSAIKGIIFPHSVRQEPVRKPVPPVDIMPPKLTN